MTNWLLDKEDDGFLEQNTGFVTDNKTWNISKCGNFCDISYHSHRSHV